MFVFSKRSLDSLEGVHPDLKKVTHRALEITLVDFIVIEGVRTKEKQKKLVEAGASWTMNSRHLTGHAIDVAAYVNGAVSWEWKHYEDIAFAFKQAAKELDIEIEWGGDWKVRDGVHFQLSWGDYPVIPEVFTKPKEPTVWERLKSWLENIFKGA